MKRVAQIIEATGFVQAVVRPTGELMVPSGMIFVEIDDTDEDPSGKFYVDGSFQDILTS